MRGKATYLVDVCPVDDDEEHLTYGPYTHKQAVEAVRRIEKFYRLEATACDVDPDEIDNRTPHVFWYRVGRWSPPVMHTAPKRPPCPTCGRKLDVWTSAHGDEETHGVCNNDQCEDRQMVDHILEERDDQWAIVEPS